MITIRYKFIYKQSIEIIHSQQTIDTTIHRQLLLLLFFRNLIGAQIDAEQKLSIGQLFFDTEKLTANENDLLKVKSCFFFIKF